MDWRDRIARLRSELAKHPLLDARAAQLESQSLNKQMELRQEDGTALIAPSSGAINVEGEDVGQRIRQIVRDAGFEGPLLDSVVTRLTQPLRPTYTFDPAATAAAQDRAAASVTAPAITYPKGEVVYRRGDVLTPAQFEATTEAIAAERRDAPATKLLGARAAVMGLVGAVGVAMAGYTVLFVPRIRRNPLRMAAISALLGALAIVACITTAMQPGLVALTAVAPTVFCAVALCIAYNQRVAAQPTAGAPRHARRAWPWASPSGSSRRWSRAWGRRSGGSRRST